VVDAWVPGARCLRAQADGGTLRGGAPRVVWQALSADPRLISAHSAAQRLDQEGRPPHLVWNPLSGDMAQLIPVVRAACLLGTAESQECGWRRPASPPVPARARDARRAGTAPRAAGRCLTAAGRIGPDRGMSTEAPSPAPLSATGRTTLRRHRERGRAGRADLYAVLDAGLICHLGVLVNGSPRVLPTTYARSGDTLYLHGSSANAGFMAADGTEVCVTVTHLDGLVLARSVFTHSVNYRSAMVFGTATLAGDDGERIAALRAIVEHLVPGQWAAARQPTARELAATAVLSVPLAEASVKVRTGGPADEPGDLARDVWAGVLPAAVTFGPPEPDPALRPGITVPAHISRFPATRAVQPDMTGNVPE